MDPVKSSTTTSHEASPSNGILRSNSATFQHVNQGSSAPSPPPPLAPTPAPKSASASASSSSPPLFSDQASRTTLSPPLGQFFINAFLQAFGLAAAIAFGVFAVESVRQAEVANGYAVKALEQARVANEVAMLSICMPGTTTNGAPQGNRLTSLCALVSAAGDGPVFPAAATAVFTAASTLNGGAMTTTTATPPSAATTATPPSAATTATPPSAATTATISNPVAAVPSSGASSPESSQSNASVIIGAVCGALGGVLIVGLIILCLIKSRVRRGRRTNGDVSPGKERQGPMVRLWRWYRATFLDSTVHTGNG